MYRELIRKELSPSRQSLWNDRRSPTIETILSLFRPNPYGWKSFGELKEEAERYGVYERKLIRFLNEYPDTKALFQKKSAGNRTLYRISPKIGVPPDLGIPMNLFETAFNREIFLLPTRKDWRYRSSFCLGLYNIPPLRFMDSQSIETLVRCLRDFQKSYEKMWSQFFSVMNKVKDSVRESFRSRNVFKRQSKDAMNRMTDRDERLYHEMMVIKTLCQDPVVMLFISGTSSIQWIVESTLDTVRDYFVAYMVGKEVSNQVVKQTLEDLGLSNIEGLKERFIREIHSEVIEFELESQRDELLEMEKELKRLREIWLSDPNAVRNELRWPLSQFFEEDIYKEEGLRYMDDFLNRFMTDVISENEQFIDTLSRVHRRLKAAKTKKSFLHELDKAYEDSIIRQWELMSPLETDAYAKFSDYVEGTWERILEQ